MLVATGTGVRGVNQRRQSLPTGRTLSGGSLPVSEKSSDGNHGVNSHCDCVSPIAFRTRRIIRERGSELEGSFSANFLFVRGQIRATWRPRSGIGIFPSLLYVVARRRAVLAPCTRFCVPWSHAALAAPTCAVLSKSGNIPCRPRAPVRSAAARPVYTCLLEQVVSNRMLWNVRVFDKGICVLLCCKHRF